MKVQDFVRATGAEFFSGVPDSQLKALCNYLYDNYKDADRHIIAANEGNATALAAGYYMATGKVPMVYMQNSGIGNIINPAASLLNEKVYGIPVIFTVGWRGEPGVHDEPQHIFQGEVTIKLLEDMEIKTFIISKETAASEIEEFVKNSQSLFAEGKSVAFVVRKGALSYEGSPDYSNGFSLTRERAIEIISEKFAGDIIISTTGKASRELFEIRERRGEAHGSDFLTVGSMGHSSSIALSVALQKKGSRIVCIDGDGACIMHMGSMAVAGNIAPENLVHIVLNNGSHETVGGEPTAARGLSLKDVARDLGYKITLEADSEESLAGAIEKVKNYKQLSFIEVKTANGARENLGRPTTTAKENVEAFKKFLEEKS